MQELTRDRIKQAIGAHRIVLFMKGNELFPQCGFSAQVVHILKELGVQFEAINVLVDPELREGIKEYADWPTLPQLYVKGQFIGGCDIVTDLYQSGELGRMLAEDSAG
jgi:monothiol glutaredoxin